MTSAKPKRRRIVRNVAIAFSCVVVAAMTLSWFVASSLIAAAPSVIGDAPHELNATSFAIESDSGSTIRGWQIQADHSKGVIVLLHGIRRSRRVMLDRARFLKELGYSTVMIDLRAHGESSGKYITIGHLERHDVRAAVEYARREHPMEPIGVIGVSLGGAAALLASPLNIDAIVLESVFPDIDDAVYNRVAERFGAFASLPSAMLLIQLEPRLGISRSMLRPIDHIAGVGCPVYVISGTSDFQTTVSETEAMFDRAQNPKELWLVEGAAHIDLLAHSPIQYRERIANFFERYFHNDHENSSEQSHMLEPAFESDVNPTSSPRDQ